jgi:hypothetical protein
MLLTARYPLLRYAYDYHDARSHSARARADAARFPTFHAFLDALDTDPDSVWSYPSPEQMAEQALSIIRERFEMVLEDLAALPNRSSVLAEGWGLRPDLVATQITRPEQAVFLVPSESFRRRQVETLVRAQCPSARRLREPEQAQRNRVERDRLLAADVLECAARLGLPVIEVDGVEDGPTVTKRVEEQFRPFLPRWLY